MEKEAIKEYAKALDRLKRVAPEYASAFPMPERLTPIDVPQPRQGDSAPSFQPDRSQTGGKHKRRGLGGIYLRGPVWWIYYSFRGKPYRESSHSKLRNDAIKFLKQRLGEIGKGELRGPDMERTTFEDLARIIEDDYRSQRRRSIPRLLTSIKGLREFFGFAHAVDITFDRLNAYVANRQASGIAQASIKYDFAVLRRAFRLARRAGKAVCPDFPTVEVNNTRQGFFEHSEFLAVRDNLPDHLRPVVTFAYLTGWRVRSEILALEWRQIDFDSGMVRLEPGTTKNKEGRVFPFSVVPDLADVLARQWELTKALQVERGVIIPRVFHRNGHPIKDFRRAWAKACRSAGVPDRIPHDFRRTAVRNLERAGVPRSISTQLTGHKTESVFRRYAIWREQDLSEGAKKLAAFQRECAAQRENRYTSVTVLPHGK